ncbi:hypothetical protein NQ317_007543 [Molorchus minor]|uniref:Lipase n=1 Tax=Molorchus minor TaxID=1323400 RepID=A0ABQ9K484_9CUCU|nr:hypothetical protein NQ317_007543 [Molorchus minor]
MSTTSLKFRVLQIDAAKNSDYQVDTYDVQTQDGYVLLLFRVRRRVENHCIQKRTDPNSSNAENCLNEKRAVFLMHGFMSDSNSFVYGGISEGLAFILANAGYDVFLGNARGNIYGQRHTTLNPQRDAAFWRFCWEEIGTKDLPALLNKALSVSGMSSISYIGHNEGTTAFYVMGSENPEFLEKIDRQISLGPIAFMKNANDEVLDNIVSHFTQKSWIMKNVGSSSISATDELTQTAKSNCLSDKYDEEICKNSYFLINGYNSKNLNMTTFKELRSHLPSSAAVREILHFAELKKKCSWVLTVLTQATVCRFSKYSETGEAEDYDLSKLTVPIALFYTPNDPLSNTDDVNTLASKLPNVYQQYQFKELTNNLDLMWSENMNNVNTKILQALEAIPNKLV